MSRLESRHGHASRQALHSSPRLFAGFFARFFAGFVAVIRAGPANCATDCATDCATAFRATRR